MDIEKIWVDDFEVLENEGQIGINMKLEDEPIETALLAYDGRNCAILIRNNKKAYILTNLLPDIRAKIFNAPEVMMIETNDNEEILNSYMCEVNRVQEIPCEDTIPEALGEMLSDIKEAYGEEGCAALAKKFWGIQ